MVLGAVSLRLSGKGKIYYHCPLMEKKSYTVGSLFVYSKLNIPHQYTKVIKTVDASEINSIEDVFTQYLIFLFFFIKNY